MTTGLDMRKEVAFLVGVALDTVDPRNIIQAINYRHGGKASPHLVSEIRREFVRHSEFLPVAIEALEPIPYFPPTDLEGSPAL